MALLPDADRSKAWADLMRKFSDERQTVNVTKAELRAAVDALDAFLDTNATAINAAIPQPARANLTTPQKAILLMYVVSQRYLTGV
jgi:hypothetical protein